MDISNRLVGLDLIPCYKLQVVTKVAMAMVLIIIIMTLIMSFSAEANKWITAIEKNRRVLLLIN